MARRALSRARIDGEFVDQALGAAQAEAQAAAGGVAVAQRLLEVGMPGPSSTKTRPTPARACRRPAVEVDVAAAAVLDGVARQLAGGRDQLGLVDQAQPSSSARSRTMLAQRRPHVLVERSGRVRRVGPAWRYAGSSR
jgi:hypothetical protein